MQPPPLLEEAGDDEDDGEGDGEGLLLPREAEGGSEAGGLLEGAPGEAGASSVAPGVELVTSIGSEGPSKACTCRQRGRDGGGGLWPHRHRQREVAPQPWPLPGRWHTGTPGLVSATQAVIPPTPSSWRPPTLPYAGSVMENCTPVVKVGREPEALGPEAMPPAWVMMSSASTTCPPSLVICG